MIFARALDALDDADALEPAQLPLGHCEFHHRLTFEPSYHRGVLVQWRCYCGTCGLEGEIGDVLDAVNHIGLGDTPEEALENYRDG